MELYFAYGSNMLPRQMKKRCPSARYVDVGWLTGFRLVFNRKGSYRAGAVASLAMGDPETDRVLGVLWELSADDLAEMDSIEDPDAYIRIAVPVSRSKQAPTYAWTYVSFPDDRGLEADADYVEVMIEGAREVGLPEAYVEGLGVWRRRAEAGDDANGP